MNDLLKRLGKTLLVVIAVTEVVAFFVLTNRTERRLEPVAPRTPSFRLATNTAHNDLGRFSFHFPPEWDVAHEEMVSTLKNPGGRAVVALGRAPAGELFGVTEQVTSRLEDTYRDVTQSSNRSTIIDGNLALVTKGVATNRQGATLRYRIAVIEGDEKNYAITAFVLDHADGDRAHASIGEIIASFEPGAV